MSPSAPLNGIQAIAHSMPPSSSSSMPPSSHHPSTLAIHADDKLNRSADVSPALHVSTTFRYASEPEHLVPAKDVKAPQPLDSHVYSRETAPTSTRLEALLSPLLHAPCLTYASGLAALHALYVFLNPKRVSIGGGYHGSHGVLGLQRKMTGCEILPLDCAPEALGPGDVVHLETPVNPTGEAFCIQRFARKAHARGAYLVVDATFGPPGLQDPFAWGADVVMHSGTKYIGGHSDLLCGVLASGREGWVEGLRDERTYLGSVMGSLEGWLGVRSLRTLEVRVRRQSRNCEQLVGWLHGVLKGVDRGAGAGAGAGEEVVRESVERVQHASLQTGDMEWLREQMPNGYGPVFAITMVNESVARRLPSQLELFHHATSLGGVESLIEWRAMSDKMVDTRLLRISVGLEHWEDLRDDLLRGLRALRRECVSEDGKEQ